MPAISAQEWVEHNLCHLISSQTAVWARDRINAGQFLYALSVATFLREDMNDIVLPPPYEIYPYLFVDADVIQKAYETKMMGEWSKHYALMFISNSERKPHSVNMTTLQFAVYQACSTV